MYVHVIELLVNLIKANIQYRIHQECRCVGGEGGGYFLVVFYSDIQGKLFVVRKLSHWDFFLFK